MNPSIILAGQPVDAVGAMAGGNALGQQVNAGRYQQQYQNALRTHGAGALQGEQGAMNALAAFDPSAMQGMQSNALNMDATRQNMQVQQEQLAMARQQAAAQAQQAVAQMTAEQAAAQREQLGNALGALMSAPDEQTYARLAQSVGIDPTQYTFAEREFNAAMVMGTMDALELRAQQAEMNAGPDMPSGVREFQFAQSQGYTGAFDEFRRSGAAQNNVTLNNGGEGRVGTIPPGYMLVDDPNAEGGQRMIQIPGGPVEQAATDAADSRARMTDLTGRQLNPTIDDLTTARDLAENGIGTTGMMSGFVRIAPVLGQDAVDMAATIDAIGSGISLENLNQMRQASPTGGALGNVSDKQSGLLAEAFGSLRQDMSKELFLYNLARVENTLNDIVHGEGNGPQRHDMQALRAQQRGEAAAPSRSAPQGSGFASMQPQELISVDVNSLTPEQLREFIAAMEALNGGN